MNANEEIRDLVSRYRQLSAPSEMRLPSPELQRDRRVSYAGLVTLMAAFGAIVALIAILASRQHIDQSEKRLVAHWSITTPESSADLSSVRTRLSAPVSLTTPTRPGGNRDKRRQSSRNDSLPESNEKE